MDPPLFQYLKTLSRCMYVKVWWVKGVMVMNEWVLWVKEFQNINSSQLRFLFIMRGYYGLESESQKISFLKNQQKSS